MTKVTFVLHTHKHTPANRCLDLLVPHVVVSYLSGNVLDGDEHVIKDLKASGDSVTAGRQKDEPVSS